MSFYVSNATFFLLHCDEWDRVVALPRHKFVTGATLLQLAFDVQYTLPSINYYSFKSRINQNAPSTLILNQTQTASDKSSQSSTNNVQVSDIDFLDDSFDFEIASLQNPEIENRPNNIGNETLNQLADQNQRFSNRFIPNNENERISFIQSRENINTTRKINSAMRMFEQYLNSAKTEFRPVCTIPPEELDIYLQEFYVGIRKEVKNYNVPEVEKQYQPGSLESFQQMINRYLRLNNYGKDITRMHCILIVLTYKSKYLNGILKMH